MRLFKFFTIIFVVIALCSPLVGCNFLFKTDFEFLYDSSRIKAIEIVVIGEVEEITDDSSEPSVIVYKPQFDVVCTVQDIERFMDDFWELDCSWAFPPTTPREGDIGVKIIYDNDEYEIICSYGQAEYRDGNYYSDCGRHSFDKTQFDELINKYTNDIKRHD